MFIFVLAVVVLSILIGFCVLFFARTYATLKRFQQNQNVIEKESRNDRAALETKFGKITEDNTQQLAQNKARLMREIADNEKSLRELKRVAVTSEQLPPIENDIQQLQDEIALLQGHDHPRVARELTDLQSALDRLRKQQQALEDQDQQLRDRIMTLDETKEKEVDSSIPDEITVNKAINIGNFSFVEKDNSLFVRETNHPDSWQLLLTV